jgi:predicted nuclease of predicted toxin-antitoxin system
MKLLVDENLSPDLIPLLSQRFPGSVHVRDVDLASAPDPFVWEYARKNGFSIITQDSDFHERSFLYGAPPKVIWVRIGNVPASVVASFIALRLDRIMEFGQEVDSTFLVLQ